MSINTSSPVYSIPATLQSSNTPIQRLTKEKASDLRKLLLNRIIPLAATQRPLSARFLRHYFEGNGAEIRLTPNEIHKMMSVVHNNGERYIAAKVPTTALEDALRRYPRERQLTGDFTLSGDDPIPFYDKDNGVEKDLFTAFGTAELQAKVSGSGNIVKNVSYKISDDYTWKNDLSTELVLNKATYDILSNYAKTNAIPVNDTIGLLLKQNRTGEYVLTVRDIFFTRNFEHYGLAKTYNIVSQDWSQPIEINKPINQLR